jgi:hypothetical protein
MFNIKQRIMWRVYAFWAARKATRPLALKVYVAALLLWRSTSYIHYRSVFMNAPTITHVGQEVTFMQGALAHAETAAVVLLFGLAAIAVWMIADLVPHHRHQQIRHASNFGR